jgi:hypothetical protein
VFWFSLQLLSETFLILRRILLNVIQMHISIYAKWPLFMSDFKEIWIFSTDFQKKNPTTQNFANKFQWQPNCSMRADGRTDMTKQIVAFRNFAYAPKKWNPNFFFSHFMLTHYKVKNYLKIMSRDIWAWIRTAETCSRLSFIITKCCVRPVFPIFFFFLRTALGLEK